MATVENELERDGTSSAVVNTNDTYEDLIAEVSNTELGNDSLKDPNGEVGLYEIAVEAQPDLIFESDLVLVSEERSSSVRPRVYLEKESFNDESLISLGSQMENVTCNVDEDTENGSDSLQWKNQKKHYFILSEAGKPIYTRHGNEEQLVTLFGVMQALVSVVEDGKDSMECILTGETKFVFVHKSPLILVAVSKLKDSIEHLNNQLQYIYNQISSILTGTQLERIFEQRRNYDLRRLLAGSERLMDNLVNYMDQDYSVLLGAVKYLPMPSTDRDAVTQIISQQCSKIKNLLFTLLIGNGQLITMLRVKKHTLHPSDVHLIINLVNSSETFKSAEGWTPICLPHFDSSVFLYAHASYLSDDCQACLLFFTSDRDSFFTLSDAKKNIVDKLRRHNNILELITSAMNNTPFITSQLGGVVDIRHFLFKLRLPAQYTYGNISPPYNHSFGHEYLLEVYRHIHGRMHSTSRPIKLLCQSTEREILFGWVTATHELYMVLEPMATKPAVMNAANSILKWLKREEDIYFMINPATL